MRILEKFMITGRGLAVVTGETTDLPVGRKLNATVHRPDGTEVSAMAYKEYVLKRDPTREDEAFLLLGLDHNDAPDGSTLVVTV